MRILSIVPFALVCLIGCGGPSLSGKYEMTADGMPPGTKITIEFNGGTFNQVVDADVAGMKMHSDTVGTYTYDGKKLVQTVKEVKIDDSKLPEQVKTGIKAQVEAAKGKSTEFEVKIEGEGMTLTNSGKSAKLTKIK